MFELPDETESYLSATDFELFRLPYSIFASFKIDDDEVLSLNGGLDTAILYLQSGENIGEDDLLDYCCIILEKLELDVGRVMLFFLTDFLSTPFYFLCSRSSVLTGDDYSIYRLAVF